MYKDKPIVDKYFKDNWTDTEIAYDGANFSIPTDKRWIQIQLIPYDKESLSTSNGLKVDYGLIRVRCYDVSATMAYKLAYKVQEFLECKKLDTDDNKQLLIDMGIGDGNGAIPLDNGIYETQLDFIVKKYS
jgi:hypothetical protein